jgi:hypothetical protein
VAQPVLRFYHAGGSWSAHSRQPFHHLKFATGQV